MYENTYKKYDPNNFDYGEYVTSKIIGIQPNYEWDYGDTFTLKFKLGKNALHEDFDIYIYIYDARYDLIYESVPEDIEIDCHGNVSFYIDQELSIKLIKGTYGCQIIAGNYAEQVTLVRASDCTLYVR